MGFGLEALPELERLIEKYNASGEDREIGKLVILWIYSYARQHGEILTFGNPRNLREDGVPKYTYVGEGSEKMLLVFTSENKARYAQSIMISNNLDETLVRTTLEDVLFTVHIFPTFCGIHFNYGTESGIFLERDIITEMLTTDLYS